MSSSREADTLSIINGSKFRKNFNDTFAFSLWLRNLIADSVQPPTNGSNLSAVDNASASATGCCCCCCSAPVHEENRMLITSMPFPKDLVLSLVDYMQERPGAACAVADTVCADAGDTVEVTAADGTFATLSMPATNASSSSQERRKTEFLLTMGCNCTQSSTDATHPHAATPAFRRAFEHRVCPGVRYVKFLDHIAPELSRIGGFSHKLTCGNDFVASAMPDFGLGCVATCSLLSSRHLYMKSFPFVRVKTLSNAVSRASSFLRGAVSGCGGDVGAGSGGLDYATTEQLPNWQMLLSSPFEPWETLEMFFCYPEAIHVFAVCLASASHGAGNAGLSRLERLVISCVANEGVATGMRAAWTLLASALFHCKELRFFGLEGTEIAPSELQCLLAAAVRDCAKLEVVSLNGEVLVDFVDVARTIIVFERGRKKAALPRHLTAARCKVVSLEIIMCGMNNNDCAEMLAALDGVHGLKKLDLSHNRIGAPALEALTKIDLPDLRCLVLDGHNFCDNTCVGLLCTLLLNNPQLVSVGLASCELGERGVHQILCAAKSERRFTQRGAQPEQAATGKGEEGEEEEERGGGGLDSGNSRMLAELNIARNKLVGKDCRHIVNAFLPNARHGSAGPKKEKKGEKDVTNAAAVDAHCGLLSLSGNMLGVKGAESIAALFPYVRHLYLDFCDLRAEGMSVLAAYVEKHAASAASAALPLESLSIASNAIGTDGALSLARILRHAPMLCYLNLSYNGLCTAQAWRSVITALFGSAKGVLSLPCLRGDLTFVDLSNNTIEDSELEQFRSATRCSDPVNFLLSTLAKQYTDAVAAEQQQHHHTHLGWCDLARRKPFPRHHSYGSDGSESFNTSITLPRLGSRISGVRDFRIDRYLDGVLTFKLFSCIPDGLQPAAAALAQHHAELRVCLNFVF